MSLTLSTEALEKIRSGNCRFIPKLLIYPDYLADATYYDLSDRVMKWGKSSGHSTLVRVSWQIPGMTLQLRNDDGYLSEDRADSFWLSVANYIPRLCSAFVGLYVDMGPELAPEQVYRYLGYINDPVYSTVRNMAVVELVTTMYQNRDFSRYLAKEFKYVVLPSNTWGLD